jgi:hypothetical protein
MRENLTKVKSRRTFQVRNALPAQNAPHYQPLLAKSISQSSRGHDTSVSVRYVSQLEAAATPPYAELRRTAAHQSARCHYFCLELNIRIE